MRNTSRLIHVTAISLFVFVAAYEGVEFVGTARLERHALQQIAKDVRAAAQWDATNGVDGNVGVYVLSDCAEIERKVERHAPLDDEGDIAAAVRDCPAALRATVRYYAAHVGGDYGCEVASRAWVAYRGSDERELSHIVMACR